MYPEHAETIEAVLTITCRTLRLSADSADEFRGWARLRLLENGEAVLRRFEGRSSLKTFLIAVVQRLYLDWRNQEWGRWRPTASAQRLGPVAVELERLVVRDGLTYLEAVRTLCSQQVATEAECEALWVQLTRRPRTRLVEEEELVDMPSPSTASHLVDQAEHREEVAALGAILERALDALPADDRLILRMRFWDQCTVAQISRLTGYEQKGLYRRFDRLTTQLRRTLESQGVTGPLLAVFEGHSTDDDPLGESPVVGPSISNE